MPTSFNITYDIEAGLCVHSRLCAQLYCLFFCQLQLDCHKIVTQREAKFTNFVEWQTHKLVYRRYAGLFFTLCVDINDNELACLEAIHLFVEVPFKIFLNFVGSS
jgi:hypothetical protein